MIALALLRFLARTPWSTAMALIGMALGVTSIVSVHLVSANVSTRLDSIVPAALSTYSHYLHRDGLEARDYFELRRLWRAGANPDILQLSPLIDATTVIEKNNVRVIGSDLLAGLTPTASPNAAPTDADSTNTPSNEFSWNGAWIDESLVGRLSIPINGVIQAPKGTLLADIGVAQGLLQWPERQLSYIGVVLDDPFSRAKEVGEKLLPGFGSGFPSAEPTLTLASQWQLVSTAEQYPAREFGKSILFNIAALGMLALLVAWLLIYQVAVSWLRRFWPVFERLHVLGVEWQHLRLWFVISIGLLAAISAALGLVAGWWLAQWLLNVAVPGEQLGLVLDGWVVVKAFGSAMSVCLLGGIWAFHQAKLGESNRTAPVWITVLLLVGALWCIFEPQSGLAGGFFTIAVLSLASSQAIAPLLTRLKNLASLVKGSYLLRIGVREALWHPGELSVAIAGLSLAIATSIGVALMVNSFRADFSMMLDHRLKYDVVVQGSEADLDSLVLLNLDSTSAARIQVYRQADIRVDGLLVTLVTSEMDAFESSRYNFDGRLGLNEGLLSEQASKTLQKSIGDVLIVNHAEFDIAGVFSAFGDLQPRLIVGEKSVLAEIYNNELKTSSVAYSTDNPEALLEELRVRFPQLELRLQSEVRRVALDTFDQTFAITSVLITIAMLVAAISVYIAVTTMRLNRRTGRQLLTTLGATRFEQLVTNVALGTGLGLVAIMIALPLGVAFGWILCHVINPRAFGWTIDLQFSTDALLLSCAWGMLAAIVAGVLQGGGEEEGGFGGR